MNCSIMAAQLMGSNLSLYYQVVNTLITAILSQTQRRWEVYPTRAHSVEQITVRQLTDFLHKAKMLLKLKWIHGSSDSRYV